MLQVDENYFVYGLIAIAVLLLTAPWFGRLVLIGRKAVSKPWWQQNRQAFSYRVYNRFVITFALFGCAALLVAKPDYYSSLILPSIPVVILLAIISYQLCWCRILKDFGLSNPFSLATIWGQWVFRFISSSTLILTLIALVFVPIHFSWETFLILAALMVGIMIWHISLAIGFLKWMKVLVPAPRYVVACIHQLAMDCKFSPFPDVWELRTAVMNAFAFQSHNAICFTTTAHERLSEPEIRAIAMHEMGHLAESMGIRFLRQLSPLCFFPLLFLKPLNEFQLGWVTIPVMLVLLQLYGIMQRHMENRADHFATATETDSEVQAYGDALIKVHQGNLLPAVLPGRARTHPHLYDRLESIGYQPDFSRPDPPAKIPAILLGLTYALIIICVSFGLLWWLCQ